jgi:general secretion pathway protein M
MRPLTPRERRLVAVGLLLLSIGLTWLLVVGPLVGGFIDRAAQRQDLARTYVRNQRLIAALPALRAAAEAQRATSARFAISAPSEALASEALKARLQRLATDEGFAITAIEDLQADAPAGAIKLRIDMTLTLNQFKEMIRRLESEDAYAVVDYLSVSADRSLAAGRLAPIDVRLELSTAWRATRARP